MHLLLVVGRAVVGLLGHRRSADIRRLVVAVSDICEEGKQRNHERPDRTQASDMNRKRESQ